MATENFTSYTEVDANADLTVTASKITFATMRKDADSYVYNDKGAAHFAGDFTHLADIQITGDDALAKVFIWSLTNLVDNFNAIDAAGGNAEGIQAFKSTNWTLYIVDLDGGTFNNTSGIGLNNNTTYYLEIERDETVGTNGTLFCRVYSDAASTTLVASDSIALATSKKDFRYIYGLQSTAATDTPANTLSGSVENLDLQEAATSTRRVSLGGHFIGSSRVVYAG